MEKAGTMSAAGYARPAVKMFITVGGLPRRDLLARKLAVIIITAVVSKP